ncbi:uncharacterized protein PHACADRAFT_251053 [Phanerochaete carnosa HHB-10118-sp]|uniref:Uncharacterized protein n=1 Tax=Phanerochaete carnosa (strain HHB-10118-sp) TaxID=650164 RepID=K5VB80_PHACS|nr:uncharacterized protein PHACADRAFT_251053 [Phanerochaete carnosa HHB-10118-sp]EKM60156.1 hypothetical protein PHACADRAFT_251053 [Phanerochaete carnosa HHB-10118-sp]
MTRQSRPSAIPVRQREESFPPRQDRAALGLKSLVPQQINIPEEAVDAELFATPAPFDLAVDGADDVSIYSTASMDEVHHMYSSSLLHETLPTLERSLEVVFADTPPVPPLHWSKHQDVRGLGAADASAMSRAVLRQENAELRKRLEEALGERDQARKVLNAMRGLVGSQAMLDST